MDKITILSQGLLVTIILALSAAIIGALLGVLLLNGRNSKRRVWVWISTGCIELFKGIPIIVQLVLVYLALPIIWKALEIPGNMLPVMIVLTLNAAAVFPGAISALRGDVTNALPVDLQFADGKRYKIKIYILALIEIFRKIIIYSSLVYFLGLTFPFLGWPDLFGAAMMLTVSPTTLIYIVIIALIYLILNVGLKFLQTVLRKTFFKPVKVVEIEVSEND